MSRNGPRVSVVLPVLNEAADLDEALERITKQTYQDFEVLVADGGSTDGTQEIVRAWEEADPRFRLLDNPRKLQSAGLNVALEHAKGKYFVRLDGHSFVENDYVESCVELLDTTGAAVVGGRMIAQPADSTIGRGIALANQSPWGAGPGRFHSGTESGPAETVYLGAFRAEVVKELGGWAEDVGVNEDYELNHRVAASGHVVWLDVDIGVGYRPRGSYRELAIQYFRYGRSKAAVMLRHPDSIRMRQLLPTLLAPAALALLPRRTRRAAVGAMCAHTAAVAYAAASSDAPSRERAAGGVAALIMHWTWSAGFWFGLVRRFPSAGSG